VFLFCLLFSLAYCQKKADKTSGSTLVEYFIAPQQTDNKINVSLDSHFISVIKGGATKNQLFVFLPGTNTQPKQCLAILRKAAGMGFHVIGLMYPNKKPVNAFCAPTNDTTCHRLARLEIIDGIDRHPDISVDPPNSIINRLTKILQYLELNNRAENWGQYLLIGKPDWSRIIISGHSQGGINADVMGKFYPVKKIIMFSAIDYLSNRTIPDWENLPANREKYFSLFNPADELLYYSNAFNGWQHLGMLDYGPVTNVDSVSYPYGHSHTLITRVIPPGNSSDKFHNSTAVDAYLTKDASGKYILDKAWEYLLNE
jgi:hypothetical protein